MSKIITPDDPQAKTKSIRLIISTQMGSGKTYKTDSKEVSERELEALINTIKSGFVHIGCMDILVNRKKLYLPNEVLINSVYEIIVEDI